MSALPSAAAPINVNPLGWLAFAPSEGFVTNAPRAILRLKGAAALFAATVVYSRVGAGWALFAPLLLVPDVSMLGDLAGRRIGAATYNLAQSYVLPVILAASRVLPSQHFLLASSLTWAALIGFDRMLGYGLKYLTGCGHTHLGVVGERKYGRSHAAARLSLGLAQETSRPPPACDYRPSTSPPGGPMQRAILAARIAVAAALALGATAEAGEPMPAPIVFFDIAGPDMGRQAAFYKAVFGWDVGKDGRFSAPVTAPLAATLRQDQADKIIYVGVDDVTATLTSIAANGGAIIQPRFEVKGVVVLGLFKDPAGNSMGLVELKDGKPKVP